MCTQNLSKYSKRFKRWGQFHFFSEFEPRQILDQCQMRFENLLGMMMNGIWQSVCLDMVNINVYAKFHHNIPVCSREAIFTFSEFGARQSLDR